MTRRKGTTKRCALCGRLKRYGYPPMLGPGYYHAPGAGKLCREAQERRWKRLEREEAAQAWRESRRGPSR